jgi:polyhydroxyalkanoate synthesis regulator phasin
MPVATIPFGLLPRPTHGSHVSHVTGLLQSLHWWKQATNLQCAPLIHGTLDAGCSRRWQGQLQRSEMVMRKHETFLQALLRGLAARQGAAQPPLPLSQRKTIQMIKRAFYSILLVGLSFSAPRVSADDDALIDALVRKGILSQKEAETIQAEVNKEAAQSTQQNSLNGVLKIGNWVNELDLYGDLRIRNYYQNTQQQLPAPPNSTRYDNQITRDRWRFRLRLNADFKLAGNFFGGVQLSTSDNRNAATGNATYTGGYDNYNIYISRAFMGWAPLDGLTFVLGRQDNPFFATEMFWAPDIAPNGIVERVDFHKLFGWGSSGSTSSASEPAGYSKDGKTAPPPAPAAPSPSSPFELSLIAGQFIFFNNNTDSGNTELKWDAYQFETQLQGKLHLFDDRVSVTWAPGVFVANNAALGPTGFLANGQPNPATAPTGGSGVLGSLNNAVPFPVTQRDELFLLAPGEISTKLGNIPVSLYWDISYNTLGDDRFNDVYGPLFSKVAFTKSGTPVFSHRVNPSFSDNFGWLVGLRVGQNRKAGDLGGLVDFRQEGIDAVDPNINSDDFGNSFLNMQGLRVTLAYNLTDFAVVSFTGWFAWNLRGSLYGGFATSPSLYPVANANATQTIAVDLLLKF